MKNSLVQRLPFIHSSIVVLVFLSAPALFAQGGSQPLPIGELLRSHTVRGLEALGPPTTPRQATTGTLMFATDVDGVYRSAPTLEQSVGIEVFGLIARTTVTQRFENPTDLWVEGIYVFPLPDRSAVDELRMRVGEREIVGEIQERTEAEKTYQKAKENGQKASLVSQERPNIFTNAVANIGPGETIVVTIEYQEDLRYDSGRISLRFPMVVAPRFIPGTETVHGFEGSGWAANTNQVPDARRITPQVILTAAELGTAPTDVGSRDIGFADLPGPSRSKEGPNPVRLRVSIDRALTLEDIASPSHSIRVDETDTAYEVSLAAGQVAANRDFVLEWRPQGDDAPQAALYTHDFRDNTYAHLMVVPPQGEPARGGIRAPREVVFVIDTSGSMGGTSIVQAKKALDLALERLHPSDTFDVVEFDDDARAAFGSPSPGIPENVLAARRFVHGLAADGGTNILAALDLALSLPDRNGGRAVREGMLRQIVFITDGSVGNEEEIFRSIQTRLGERRLFTVGIGSAPNHYFMSRSAEFGRGTFTTISDLSEVETRMAELFVKIESPALVDIEARWIGWSESQIAEFDVTPSTLPDLFAGEPIVLNARLPQVVEGGGELLLTGRRGTESWSTRLAIVRGARRDGVDRLWARQKIADLMGELSRGRSEADIRPAVVELGLNHHLVTRYTSLVAVDPLPTRPPEAGLQTRAIPARLPAGWQAEKVFGTLPKGGTGSPFLLVMGLVSLLLAARLMRRET